MHKNSRLLKEKENEEKQKLEDEVQKFKYDLNSSTSGKKYYEAKKRLQDFLTQKMKEKLTKQRYRNFGSNYFTTKEFFRQFRKKRRDSFIEKLKNKDGEVKTKNEELLDIAKDYYSELYKKRDTDTQTQNFFLNKITEKLSNTDLDVLNQRITMSELKEAVLRSFYIQI